MLANFLIGLREGLEATLIVSILLAHVTRLGRLDQRRQIWAGTLAAITVSFAIGISLQLTSNELSDSAEELFAGTMGIATVALVTWMIFWMASRSRALRGQLEREVESALTGSGAALAVLAFVSVIREGLETALFLWSGITATSGGSSVTPVIGALLGLSAAALLGVGLYRGALRVDIGKLFRWSGAALVVVAAGVLAYSVHDLQEFGLLPGAESLAFDLTAIFPPDSWYATLLRGLLSFRGEASWLEAGAWWLYAVPALWLFIRRSAPKAAAEPVPAAVGR